MNMSDLAMKQYEFQKKNPRTAKVLSLSKDKQILKHTNSMMHELIEVERELNYKYWKAPVKIDWDKVNEELADVFIFFLNACNAAELQPIDLFKIVADKQNVNQKRQDNDY